MKGKMDERDAKYTGPSNIDLQFSIQKQKVFSRIYSVVIINISLKWFFGTAHAEVFIFQGQSLERWNRVGKFLSITIGLSTKRCLHG